MATAPDVGMKGGALLPPSADLDRASRRLACARRAGGR